MTILWYLGSPYSKRVPRDAYREAAEACALLFDAGHNVYSPVVEGHALTLAADIRRPHPWWINTFCLPRLARCDGLIVLQNEGWDVSEGVAREIGEAEQTHKPVLWMRPGFVPPALFKERAA